MNKRETVERSRQANWQGRMCAYHGAVLDWNALWLISLAVDQSWFKGGFDEGLASDSTSTLASRLTREALGRSKPTKRRLTSPSRERTEMSGAFLVETRFASFHERSPRPHSPASGFLRRRAKTSPNIVMPPGESMFFQKLRSRVIACKNH